jgi:TolA-binding protein
MRCKYCGSNIIHPDKEHKTFSAGKAVAGAVTFGVVGAVTGFIGKDIDGYRCGSCGAFMDAPMDFSTELSVDSAIRDAESGGSRAMFDYFKSQYGNIQANIPTAPVQVSGSQPAVSVPEANTPVALPKEIQASTVKHSYRTGLWYPECPVYVESIIVKATKDGDALSLVAWNQGSKTIRSAYYQAKVFDDTGDEISTCQCVYQGLSVASGKALPVDKEFKLNTELAYRVELYCEKIAMEDGSVWRASESDSCITLAKPIALTSQNFPRLKWLKFFLESYSTADPNGSLYLPVEHEDYWRCICGIPVKSGCKCPHCGADVEKLKELVSQKKLQAAQQASVKDVAERRAKITAVLYDSAIARKNDEIYASADRLEWKDTEESLNESAQLFDSISDWKDSAERAQKCRDRIPVMKAEKEKKAQEEKRKAEEKAQREAEEKAKREAEEKERREKKKKRNIKVCSITAAAVLVIVLGVLLTTKVIIPIHNYNSAVSLMENGDYTAAIAAFKAMDGYKDSDYLIDYAKALSYMESEDYSKAIKKFESLGDYSDAQEKIVECQNLENEAEYQAALGYMESGKYAKAIKQFESLGDYSDAQEKIVECQNLEKEEYYRIALDYMDSGDYSKAIEKFEYLGDYSDSQEKIIECQSLLNENLSLVNVGDTITLGNYEQDNDTTNGTEPIEWIVLKKDKSSIFIISKYILDAQAFNSEQNDVTWENCTLRTWLNETFYNEAFSVTEQAKICTSTCTAFPNSYFSTSAGSTTSDKIFILSNREALSYFSSGYKNAGCSATAYAIAQGLSPYGSENYCPWLLRTPGMSQNAICLGWIYDNNSFYIVGNDSESGGVYVDEVYGVRPAMWISTAD